jgi:hypothetical protein
MDCDLVFAREDKCQAFLFAHLPHPTISCTYAISYTTVILQRLIIAHKLSVCDDFCPCHERQENHFVLDRLTLN